MRTSLPITPITRVVDGRTLVENFEEAPSTPKDTTAPTTPMDPPAGITPPAKSSTPAAGTPGRALSDLCHHGDEVDDGLSECETFSVACLDYDGNGHNFDDDTCDIDFEDEGSG